MQCNKIPPAITPMKAANTLRTDNSGHCWMNKSPSMRKGTKMVTTPGMRKVKNMALKISCGLILIAPPNDFYITKKKAGVFLQ
jgi:hypothetical protein